MKTADTSIGRADVNLLPTGALFGICQYASFLPMTTKVKNFYFGFCGAMIQETLSLNLAVNGNLYVVMVFKPRVP